MAQRNLGKFLTNKVAVITASTDGYASNKSMHIWNWLLKYLDFSIGYAIARRFAAEGARVVVSSRKSENVAKAVDQLKTEGHENVLGVKCHVSNADDRKQLFDETVKKFGKIDILVSNAAVNPTVGTVLDCSEEAWDKIFDVNVKAAFLLAKEATPIIRKQSSGSIIFMSSYAGLNPFPVRVHTPHDFNVSINKLILNLLSFHLKH